MVGVVSFALFGVAVCFALRRTGVVVGPGRALSRRPALDQRLRGGGVGELNQVSAVFNVLVVGLGGELGIHFCLRYAELAASGLSRSEALVETARSIGSSLFSSAGTTSIGFLVFLPTDYRGVAELGLISGGGVILRLLATFTVLPAVLALVKVPHAAAGARLAAEPRAAPREARLADPLGGARGRHRRRAARAAHPLRPQPDPPARSRVAPR